MNLLQAVSDVSHAVFVSSFCRIVYPDVWLRYDSGNHHRVFPGYGIFMGCFTDTDHVFQCDYVYAGETDEKRL